MEQEKKPTKGGKRPGAGRPKGAVQKAPKKEYARVFSTRCSTEAQYEKLKAYWQTIKNDEQETINEHDKVEYYRQALKDIEEITATPPYDTRLGKIIMRLAEVEY